MTVASKGSEAILRCLILLPAYITAILAVTTTTESLHLCDAPKTLLSIPGDAVITGLFDGHSGPNCTDPLATGLQQMAAAAWAVNALNDITFVTGVKLGLTLYDACSSPDAARRALVTALVEQECDDAYPLGKLMPLSFSRLQEGPANFGNIPRALVGKSPQSVVTTRRISGSVRPLTDALGPLSPLLTTVAGGPPASLLANASVAVLRALNWTEAAVAAGSPKLLRSFLESATDEGLCISGQAILPGISLSSRNSDELEWEVDAIMRSLPESAVVIAAGPWKGIRTLLTIARGLGLADRRDWIIMPTEESESHYVDDPEPGFDLENSVAELAEYASGSTILLVLPQTGDAQLLEETLGRWRESKADEVADDTAIRSVPPAALLDVAGGVLSFARRLTEALGDSKTLDDLPPRSLHHGTSGHGDSGTEILAAAEALHLPAEEATMIRSPLLFSRVLSDGQVVDLGIFEVTSGLHLSDIYEEDLSKWTRNFKHSCRNCRRCLNLEDPGLGIYWRSEGWVAAVVTLGATGVLCSLAVTIYLIIRICKTTPLEGNPALSFVMLLTVMITYGAVVPYAINAPKPLAFANEWDADEQDAAVVAAIICTLRLLCPPMAYALLFSTMLSRCIMLASSDSEGFLSHVSGPLQSTLMFFMASVQVGVTVEFWLLVLLETTPESLAAAAEPCAANPVGFARLAYFLIPLHSYDALLLLLLTFISPFAAKSRRNYREGALLAVASGSCLAVWLGWGAAFIAAPPEWRDVSVAGGLVATATSVLVGLFIPRTYLMTSAAARDRMASALPPLAATGVGTSILDLNYRASNQALYDSVGQGLHRSQEILRSPMLNSGIAAGSSTTALVRATSASAVGQSNPSYFATERPDTPVSIRGPAARGGTNAIPEGSIEDSIEDSPPGGGGRLMRIDSIDSEAYERYGAKPSPHKVTRF